MMTNCNDEDDDDDDDDDDDNVLVEWYSHSHGIDVILCTIMAMGCGGRRQLSLTVIGYADVMSSSKW